LETEKAAVHHKEGRIQTLETSKQALEDEVATASATVQGKEEAIQTLEASKRALEDEVANATQQRDALQEQVDALQEQVDELQKPWWKCGFCA